MGHLSKHKHQKLMPPQAEKKVLITSWNKLFLSADMPACMNRNVFLSGPISGLTSGEWRQELLLPDKDAAVNWVTADAIIKH